MFVLFLLSVFQASRAAFSILDQPGSFAQFPKWDACVNASISFDFRTDPGAREGLLMYVDDGGQYDFFDVMHRNGRVEVELSIVDGVDGAVSIIPSTSNVNDGRWHSVKIQRRRMETTVTVDSVSQSQLSFGSDQYFGAQDNSYVYFGGLPEFYDNNFQKLANPTSYLRPRFQGQIRNVIYNNCTCERTRVQLMDGVAVTPQPEACDRHADCAEGCLCVSGATAFCDCSEKFRCFAGE